MTKPGFYEDPDSAELVKYEETLRFKVENSMGNTHEILSAIISGIVEEIDALKLERKRLSKNPKLSIGMASEKLIRAYKILGDVVISQRKIAMEDSFSFSSPYVLELVRVICSSVEDVLRELKVPDSERDLFFQRLNSRMGTLQAEVEERVSSKKQIRSPKE